MRDLFPYALIAGACCLWPGVWAIIAFLIGRGYRVRFERS